MDKQKEAVSYIDEEDGKLDVSRIPIIKRYKILGIISLSVFMGIGLLLLASKYIVIPVATFMDFNNLYIYKIWYILIMFLILLPILIFPFNIMAAHFGKTGIRPLMDEYRQGFQKSHLKSKLKGLVKKAAILTPISVVAVYGLQKIFGAVGMEIIEGEAVYEFPSPWFNVCYILIVIIGQWILRRISVNWRKTPVSAES